MGFKPGNLKLNTVRKLLENQGCKKIGINGGHEKWSRNDLLRPIILQTHIDPVPKFIVLQIIRTLKIDKDNIESILDQL